MVVSRDKRGKAGMGRGEWTRKSEVEEGFRHPRCQTLINSRKTARMALHRTGGYSSCVVGGHGSSFGQGWGRDYIIQVDEYLLLSQYLSCFETMRMICLFVDPVRAVIVRNRCCRLGTT